MSNLGWDISPLEAIPDGEDGGSTGGNAGAPGGMESDGPLVGGDFSQGKGMFLTDASGRSWATLDVAPPKFNSPDSLPPLLVQVRAISFNPIIPKFSTQTFYPFHLSLSWTFFLVLIAPLSQSV